MYMTHSQARLMAICMFVGFIILALLALGGIAALLYVLALGVKALFA